MSCASDSLLSEYKPNFPITLAIKAADQIFYKHKLLYTNILPEFKDSGVNQMDMQQKPENNQSEKQEPKAKSGEQANPKLTEKPKEQTPKKEAENGQKPKEAENKPLPVNNGEPVAEQGTAPTSGKKSNKKDKKKAAKSKLKSAIEDAKATVDQELFKLDTLAAGHVVNPLEQDVGYLKKRVEDLTRELENVKSTLSRVIDCMSSSEQWAQVKNKIAVVNGI